MHLLTQDLSENCLKDLTPIHALNFLLTLKADNNLLTTAKLDEVSTRMLINFFLNIAIKSTNCVVTMLTLFVMKILQ